MKKLFITLMVALTSVMAANAQKFALVDMEYILKNIPAYERANEQLNQISKKWEGEVEALLHLGYSFINSVKGLSSHLKLCLCNL